MASAIPEEACSLPECRAGRVDVSGGKVEVRAFEPPPDQRSALTLSWRPGGVAVFHRQCWAEVVRACRGESSKINRLSHLDCKMVEEAKRTAEFHDSDSVVMSAAQQVAQLLRDSRYAIAFTGAGISTAAGIGDFRGKDGHWTNRDKQKAYGQAAKPKARKYRLSDLRPTYSHEAIVKLLEMGMLKYLISQNTDGLHRLSGIPGDKISELHGNSFIEKCEKCNRRYERQFSCRSNAAETKRCPQCHCLHRTGRRCESKGCNGHLMNTIINFGDDLEPDVLGRASQNASRNDLVLCLGTTLQVSPANRLVTMGSSPPTLVLCNRQPTPYDDICCDGRGNGVRVFGDCDRLMRKVMEQLLGDGHLASWEAERSVRMEQYSSQRPS